VRLAEDPALFEKVAEFYGFEPCGHMRVHRYRGGRLRRSHEIDPYVIASCW
jgi:hypothetical protein